MRLSAPWLSALAALALLVGACSDQRDYNIEFISFGTVVSITAYDVRQQRFDSAASQIEKHFSTLSNEWYPWSAGELMRINTAIANGEAIAVSPPLVALIKTAANYEALSGGRFNVGIGRLSELWGFDGLPESPPTVPSTDSIDAILSSQPGARALNWEQSTLSSNNRNVLLDLGGLAKGAILLDARHTLEQHEIGNAIINLGGDLTVIGNVKGRDARIGIRSPTGDTPIAGLDVASGESVFTSGIYERYIEIDGIRYAHILDPRTGFPIQHTASVTVVHVDPLLADAAATALLVGGADEFDALVAAFGLEFALLIDASGDTRLTPSMRKRLHWLDEQ